jgi:hypothetical protein
MAKKMINYIGTSMFPTLKTGDILRVVSYKERAVRIGDVVLFQSPYGRTPIVHRVVSVDKKGVRTKGDNKIAIDDCILQPNDIIGRVVSAQRGKKGIKIPDGFPGQIYGRAIGMGKRIDIVITTILRPAYRWFAQTGIFRKLFSRWIQTRVLCFKCGNGIEMQLQLGRRIIGRRLPGQDRWYIQRPFLLFIDEPALPGAQDIKKDHLEFELSNN